MDYCKRGGNFKNTGILLVFCKKLWLTCQHESHPPPRLQRLDHTPSGLGVVLLYAGGGSIFDAGQHPFTRDVKNSKERPYMTPKKVWGVIIIVVGIFMFFNGATKCSEADFYGNEIQTMGRQISKYGGVKSFNSKHYEKIIEQEKTNGVIGAILGLAFAVGGTFLLFEKKYKYSERTKSNFDKKDGEWKF